MNFNYNAIDLPVKEVIPSIQEELKKSFTLIVKAPTGAGKSTLAPLALLNEKWLDGQKIIMLEPRRLAAKTIANRMAQLLDEKVGETIGYRIRFETIISDKTRLEVVTEGILTRMLHEDNELKGIGLVIFDEFHERNIHADVAMALCREAQQVLRPELRILVMSATLNIPLLEEMLQAKVIESKGRQYPVEINYVGDSDKNLLPELTARTVKMAFEKNDGDALVFLPGQAEIKKCEEILKKRLKEIQIHILYGQLSHGKQMAAILPDRNGRRKVVLATNIAETSLTIEGVKIVVDSGFTRISRFNPNSGLSGLETVQISRDSADQRAGRAGRLGPGVCYRMWTKTTHNRLEEQRKPEIEQADLSSLVLDLAQWGISDPTKLCWVTPPPNGHILQAKDLLHQLDALENNKITDHGKKLHKLPTHPRIAHMLLFAEKEGLLQLATDIAPLLEERDPLPQETGIDINLRIEAMRRFRKEGVGSKNLSRIEKMANQYRRMFGVDEDNSSVEDLDTGLLLAYAYPERIACARPGNNAQFQLANGRLAMASHKDNLAHEPWLAVAHVNERQGIGKIFMASSINPRDLASMVKEQEVISWDHREGGLIARKEMRIGNIILQSNSISNPDKGKVIEAIIQAIRKDGKKLLNWDEEVLQWQNRVNSLKIWNPEEKWPNPCTDSLLISCTEWIVPYLNNIRKAEDLKKLNIKEILNFSLDHNQQKDLETLTPTKIEVPSGSKIKLEYQFNGELPVLPVRLQECFGLQETPTINNGKTKVIMHLLSPGFKIVQITSDLKSFWNNAYFEVRKQLKIKHPKHSWPDTPLEAEATRGVRRRK